MRCTLNGDAVEIEAEPTELLLDVVRRAGCTGPKEGCGIGVCGACTVVVDGLPVSTCLYLAGMATGADVWTVEGLTARDPRLVDAFADAAALQCGFCTPGQVTTAWWLAHGEAARAPREPGAAAPDGVAPDGAAPEPATPDLTAILAGNLCRCTGYLAIRRAVETYRAGH